MKSKKMIGEGIERRISLILLKFRDEFRINLDLIARKNFEGSIGSLFGLIRTKEQGHKVSYKKPSKCIDSDINVCSVRIA